MIRYNWIVEPDDMSITPSSWGLINNIKFDIIYMDVDGHTTKRIVKYVASMTEEDAAAFKLYATGMTIKKARW